MKEELEVIALELRKWAKKYNKDYVDITSINNNLMGGVNTADKDYEYLRFFIQDDEVQDAREEHRE